MAYISISELKHRIEQSDTAELSDDSTGLKDNDSTLNEIIYDAQSLVDSYLQTRHDTPLSEPAPRAVRNTTGTIALYYLHLRREWTITEALESAYAKAEKWLADIAAGKAMLDIANNSNASGYFDAETRIFQGISHGNTTDKFNGF